jgi:transposase
MAKSVLADAVERYIQRKTSKKYSAEEKIRIILAGLCGESSIAELCRCWGIPTNLYCR